MVLEKEVTTNKALFIIVFSVIVMYLFLVGFLLDLLFDMPDLSSAMLKYSWITIIFFILEALIIRDALLK